MVRTGAHVYVKYGWEGATLGNLASGAAVDKKFGLQDKVSSLTLTHNKMNLNKLNQNTVDKFAYGQQQGTASMSFTLSNPWIFGTVLGAPPSPASSGGNYTYTYSSNPATMSKDARTIQMILGFDATSGGNIFRTLKGGIVGSLAINAAVGGLVDCSADVTYGLESAPTTSGSLSPPTKPSQEFPYTFAHAELMFGGVEVVQCQDASINISQNAELLYALDTHSAVAAFKRVLDITGAFKASWIDKTLLDKLIAQLTEDGSGETVGGGATTEFRLSFVKSATESIIITLTGLAINDLGISGLEPVEPVFQDITWTAKTISIAAITNSSAEQ